MGVEKVFSHQTNDHVIALENAFSYYDDVPWMELESGDAPQKYDLSLVLENVPFYDGTAP